MKMKLMFLIAISHITFEVLASNSLSYSGRLVQASGAPVTGPVNLRAELVYTNATSTILCFQNLSSVALTKGVFHLKLDFDCTPKTITQILSETPNGESVAIRIIDQTNTKTYPFQAMHSIPFSKVAEQLSQMGASSGQALVWDGSKWAPTSVGTGNGTVTNIITGTGLTGGPISATGTISIANSGVGTSQLADNAVTAAKINAGEITSSHISATANIPYSKLSIGVGEIPQDRINGLAGSMSALIEDVIADAVTGKAPSQNAVYDALGLKADRSNVTQNITAASLVGLVAPTVGSAAANRDYVDNSSATVDTRITNEVSTINTALGNKYDKTGGVITGDVTLNTQLLLKGGANFVTLKANSGTSNYVMTLPTSAGTNGYVLQTDGAGVLSWVNPSSVVTGSGTVNSASITDGSIVDADINASANIAQSKILNLTTDLAGKQPLISAGTISQYYRGDKTFVDLGTDVRATALTGFVIGANSTVLNTDTTLGAFQKVQGQINATNTSVAGKEPALVAGTTSQYYRGDKSWQTLNGAAVANIPAGSIAATNVQAALNELDTEKQASITAASALAAGSVTTSLQNGVNINPFNTGVGQTGELRFYELAANGSHYTSFKSPDALAANINYVMPSAAPTAGQVLSSSAAGVLSWISIPSAPVTTVFGRSGVVSATAGDYTAAQINNVPAGTIAASTVQAALNELDTEKQGLITAGTTAQYYRGDKTFVDFGTEVRATALTGYAVGANTALVATDTTLGAFQKVQGQINATNTAVAGKEPAITAGTTAQYIRGDKTLSTFATDVINSVLSTFTVGTGTKPAVVNTDTVAGAFGKVQKTLNDINADYVSKSQDQTINGALAINSATGFITVPTPINPNDAVNKAYVDSYGQWLENGANIYFNTGNVGIGTTSPGESLDVRGNLRVGGSDAGPNFIAFRGTVGDGPGSYNHGYIGERIYDGTEKSELFIFKGNDVNATSGPDRIRVSSGEIAFDTIPHNFIGTFEEVASSTLPIRRMSILNNGNVGIGAVTPLQKFVVQGGNLSLNSTGNVTPQYEWRGSDNSLRAYISHATETVGGVTDENRFYQLYGFKTFYTGGAERVRIDPAGNVGIGTTSPSYRLQVTKTAATDPALMIGGAFAGGPRIQTYGLDADPLAYMGLGTDMSGESYDHSIYTSAPAQNGKITFGQYDGTSFTERMRIHGNGNVGIGTTSPDTTLTVSSGTGARIKVTGAVGSGIEFNDVNTRITIPAANTMGFYSSNIERMNIDPAGLVTVNHALRTAGNVGDCAGGWACNAYFWDLSTSGIYYSVLQARSDRRLKKNIQIVESDVVQKLLGLNPVIYEWKDKKIKGKKYGFIAQEVEEVMPNLVLTSDDKMKTKSVDYMQLISPLIKGFQLHNQELVQIKNIQSNSERKISSLEKEVKKLRAENMTKDQEINELKNAVCEINPKAKICH